MDGSGDRKSGAVIGAGLVGSVAACCLADRGYDVKLFELRKDIRNMEVVRGRSINMALSERGRAALRHVGIEKLILDKAIPMHARFIHGDKGKSWQILYGQRHQCIYSIDRRILNEELITAAERRSNVTIYFEHKLIKCAADTGEIVLYNAAIGEAVTYRVDLIVGADGAYSATRRELMKRGLFDYSQRYIEHGYMELSIPPTENDDYAMDVNYLHIWPRNEFMMIGLPNLDKSFTVTLFMPFSQFDAIKNEDDLMRLFKRYFNDSIPLMGEKRLKELYFSGKAQPLISVKCSPHHFGKTAILIGDAGHAMVPFYGQGMNGGLEDCLVLDSMLDKYANDIQTAIAAYSAERVPDAHAVVDLAMYNYVEMRAHVNNWSYLMRKAFDNFLHYIMPYAWVPLYTSVSFTRMRYSHCVANKKRQDKIIGTSLRFTAFSLVVALAIHAFPIVRKLGWPHDS